MRCVFCAKKKAEHTITLEPPKDRFSKYFLCRKHFEEILEHIQSKRLDDEVLWSEITVSQHKETS